MSLIGTTPAPITPQQVLGNLLGLTKDSAQAIEAGVTSQPRTVGLAIAATNDMAAAELLIIGSTRPPARNPFSF